MTEPAGTKMKMMRGGENSPFTMEPAQNKPNGGVAMANQHEKMVEAAKKVNEAKGVSPALKVSAADKKRLEASGVRPFYGELKHDRYTLSETAQICDISGAWLRTCIKNKKVPATKVKKGNKELWMVERTVVAELRANNIEKHLDRLDNVGKPKKYQYRRPSEWAYHLTVKAIKKDAKLSAAQKKSFVAAMNRYKTAWEKAYQERLAKKEANKAKKEAESKK